MCCCTVDGVSSFRNYKFVDHEDLFSWLLSSYGTRWEYSAFNITTTSR